MIKNMLVWIFPGVLLFILIKSEERFNLFNLFGYKTTMAVSIFILLIAAVQGYIFDAGKMGRNHRIVGRNHRIVGKKTSKSELM